MGSSLLPDRSSGAGVLHDAKEIRTPGGHRVEETGIAVLDESAVHAVDAVTVADTIEVLGNEVLVSARDVDGRAADDQSLDFLLLILFHMWFLSGLWPVVISSLSFAVTQSYGCNACIVKPLFAGLATVTKRNA